MCTRLAARGARITVLRTTVAALVLAGGASSASAQVTGLGPAGFPGDPRINFDDVAAPSTGTVAVNTRYAAQGVRFTRDDGQNVFAYNWTGLGRGTTSGPNVLATISGTGAPTYVGYVNVLFDAPQTRIGAYFGNDQFSEFRGVALSVFGAGGLIGSVYVGANGNTDVDQFIGLASTTAFTRARFQVDEPTSGILALALDDLVYGADASVVPEPTTYALLGAGLVGVAGMAARRRRVATA